MANKTKVKYLLDTGYAGSIGGASISIPKAGIYEVTEEQALYLVEQFPDWFELVGESKTKQDPPPDEPHDWSGERDQTPAEAKSEAKEYTKELADAKKQKRHGE